MAISITKTGGNGQSAKLNQLYANNLQVQVVDNATIPPSPVTSGTVSFQNINNLVTQPAAPFNGAGSQTGECGAGGYASTNIKPRANGVAGKVTIRCWGFGTETNFTLTNKAPSGSPVVEGITQGTGNNQVLPQNSPQLTPITVTTTDQYDAPIVTNVRFTLPGSGPSAVFVAGGTTAVVASNASGIATCPDFVVNSQLGLWSVNAQVTADTTLQTDFSMQTVPSSGIEVCTVALTCAAAATLPFGSFAWGNPAQWSIGGANTGVYGFDGGAVTPFLYTTIPAGLIAAIPNAAEITRLTYTQQVSRSGPTQGKLVTYFENTGFASPRCTIAHDTTSFTGSLTPSPFTWTAFQTPNAGSKLFGSDVKSPNFRIVQYMDANVAPALGSTTILCVLLRVTICYIEPSTADGNTPAGQLCEV
jgi:hypothetical protein